MIFYHLLTKLSARVQFAQLHVQLNMAKWSQFLYLQGSFPNTHEFRKLSQENLHKK
jgi:hypothetical protein